MKILKKLVKSKYSYENMYIKTRELTFIFVGIIIVIVHVIVIFFFGSESSDIVESHHRLFGDLGTKGEIRIILQNCKNCLVNFFFIIFPYLSEFSTTANRRSLWDVDKSTTPRLVSNVAAKYKKEVF